MAKGHSSANGAETVGYLHAKKWTLIRILYHSKRKKLTPNGS